MVSLHAIVFLVVMIGQGSALDLCGIGVHERGFFFTLARNAIMQKSQRNAYPTMRDFRQITPLRVIIKSKSKRQGQEMRFKRAWGPASH
jgi:hypothetical protein